MELVRSAKSNDDNWWRRIARNLGAGVRLLMRSARPPKRLESTKLDWRLVAIGAVISAIALLLVGILLDGAAIRGASALPNWLRETFERITGFGKSGWILWPLGIVLISIAAVSDRLPRRTQLTLLAIAVRIQFVFLAIAVPGLFVTVVKRLIGRARPYISESIDPVQFRLLAWRSEFASFPSGHATTAVAAAVAIGTIWPRARIALWIYAVLIMTSRVALNAHYVTDVLAAAGVGAVGAMMVRYYFAMRRLGFSIAPDRSMIRYPVPSRRHIRAIARDLLAEKKQVVAGTVK